MLSQCTTSKLQQKIITRHIWQEYKDEIDSHRLEARGKAIYKRRKETVERSFADTKELHSHSYARMRGKKKVQEQAYLTAACQNMKKIALHIGEILNNLIYSAKIRCRKAINKFLERILFSYLLNNKKLQAA